MERVATSATAAAAAVAADAADEAATYDRLQRSGG